MPTAAVGNANMLGVNLTQTQPAVSASTPEYPGNQFKLGATTIADDGSRYVYAVAPAAVPLGAAVSFDTGWNANLLTTTSAGSISGQKIGFASQVAFAAGDRGWFQVDGLCPAILVAASTTAYSQLYSSATPGQLTSTATGAVAINGAIVTTANGGSAGVQPGILNNAEILLTT